MAVESTEACSWTGPKARTVMSHKQEAEVEEGP